MELIVKNDCDGQRLDSYIASECEISEGESLSRSRVQKLIEDGLVLLDGAPAKASFRVKAGSVISLELPEPEMTDIIPEDIPLDILYEDQDILIVNKPKGMVVHPSAGHYSGTLVNAVLFHCGNSLSGINGELRPGIVHRIDMDTTGSLIICKNDRAHNHIAEQLSQHSIKRVYYALCLGRFKEDCGRIDAPIGRDPSNRKKMSVRIPKGTGKRAVTNYRVIESYGNVSFVECALETGRTHQIRVHMTSIGHPLLGDEVYYTGLKPKGKLPALPGGQCLHAAIIGFIHPTSGEYLEFEAPLPEYFTNLLEYFRAGV